MENQEVTSGVDGGDDVPPWDVTISGLNTPPTFHHPTISMHYLTESVEEHRSELRNVQDLEEKVKDKVLNLKEVFNCVLYSTATSFEEWFAEIEDVVDSNAILKDQYEAIDKAPNGCSYTKEERLVLMLGKALLLLWKMDQNPMVTNQPLLWILSNLLLQYVNQIQMSLGPPFCRFAMISGVAALLHMGFSPDTVDGGGFNIIHYSIQQNRYDVIYFLSRWEADLDHLSSDPFSVTPLHLSIERRDTLAARLLLDLGADVNIGDDKGVSPLMKAVGFYSADMFQLLLDRGANRTLRDTMGNSLLHHAAISGKIFDNINVNFDEKDLKEGNSLGQTTLHLAVLHRRVAIVNILLDRGVDPEMADNEGNTPLDYAARMWNADLFSRLLSHITRTVDHREVFEMRFTLDQKCLRRGRRVEAQEYVRSLPKTRAQFCFARDPEMEKDLGYGFPNTSLQRLSTHGPRESREALLTVALDKCIYGNKVVRTSCLETDNKGYVAGTFYKHVVSDGSEEGKVVRMKRFDSKSESLLSTLCKDETLFRSVAHHPTLMMFMNNKWNRFGFYYFLVFLMIYLIRMLFLTLSLGIAARPSLTDPTSYATPLDHFRLVCEIVTLMIILTMIVMEIVNIVEAGKGYFSFQEFFSYTDWAAIFFTLLIIPLRATSTKEQWIIASFAYFFHGLRAFEFAALFRPTGVYVQTLRYIFKEDVLKFVTIFVVVLLLFMGCLGLALRDDLDTAYQSSILQNGTLTHLNEDVTSLFYQLYYVGLRTMIESSSVWDYVAFRWLGVIVYLSFLFVVVTVLLNVLIAQMTDTYSRVLSTAFTTYLYLRALFIVKVERKYHLWGLLKRCKRTTVREEMFKELIWVEDFTEGRGIKGWLRKVKRFVQRFVSAEEFADMA